MKCFEYHFDSYSVAESNVPVPENLEGKDPRADSAARAAVFSATAAMQSVSDTDRTSFNVMVLNREGCASHLQKVTAGIAKRTPRQGLFARGGPQTLATYAALALGCHGSAFTLVGEQDVLAEAITTALYLANNGTSTGTVLTVVVTPGSGGFKATSVLIKPAQKGSSSSTSEQQAATEIFDCLATVFHNETLLPSGDTPTPHEG